jgi:hypothetical protein
VSDLPKNSSVAPSSIAPWRRRAFLTASVLCVGVTSIRTDGGRSSGAWLLALIAVVLEIAASGRASGLERATGWGVAVVLASLGAGEESRALDVARVAGEAAVVLAACVATARIVPDAGLWRADPPPAFPAVVAVVGLSLLASVARAFPGPGAMAWFEGLSQAIGWTAIAGSLLALFGMIAWTLRARRLELAVVERVVAMRGLLLTACAAGVFVAVLGHARADRVAVLVVAGAGVALVACAQARDAVLVARTARRVVVLTIAGGGVGLLGAASVAGGFRGDAWVATVITAALAVVLGTVASQLEGPMRPAGGTWLDAFERAWDKAASAEPHDAIRETLLALRATGGAGSRSPELWTFSPTSMTTVDAAGYVHEQSAEVPDALVTVASGETEGTLRVEVLAALEVRRPEVRPLYSWMNAHDAAFATVVGCAGETEGVLVMPRAGRVEPVTLEEVQALRRVADRLAVACRSRGAQARMLARANEAVERAAQAEARAEALLRERALDLTRNALAAARLARPATVGIYSAASRLALEALERRTAAGSPVALVVPSGGDPVPYLARAHLAGVRAGGPLVLVDGTSVREHDAARWADATSSPLALAEGGMLVLLDGAALPGAVQQLVARACAERRAPWDGDAALDVLLALTGIAAPADLVAKGRLDPVLAARLGDARDAAIALPRLRDRTEDVRAILTDSLARQGMRVLGRPVGIDSAAYARLVEHEFPGEDAELAAIVERLVSRCAQDPGRDIVRATDLPSSVGPGAWI